MKVPSLENSSELKQIVASVLVISEVFKLTTKNSRHRYISIMDPNSIECQLHILIENRNLDEAVFLE